MVNDASGDEYPTGGIYLEVQPYERLRFTWGDPDADPSEAPVVTVTLAPEGARTRMTFDLRAAGRPGTGSSTTAGTAPSTSPSSTFTERRPDMGRLIVGQLVTADGYAADTDGGMRFLRQPDVLDPDINAEQLGTLSGVDAIVFDATTYRMFADYWPAASVDDEPVTEPINRLPKHVVSNTLDRAPGPTVRSPSSAATASTRWALKQRCRGRPHRMGQPHAHRLPFLYGRRGCAAAPGDAAAAGRQGACRSGGGRVDETRPHLFARSRGGHVTLQCDPRASAD